MHDYIHSLVISIYLVIQDEVQSTEKERKILSIFTPIILSQLFTDLREYIQVKKGKVFVTNIKLHFTNNIYYLCINFKF